MFRARLATSVNPSNRTSTWLSAWPLPSGDEITAAYRRGTEAASRHPSRGDADTTTLRGVIDAYKVLALPQRRRHYGRLAITTSTAVPVRVRYRGAGLGRGCP